MKFLEEEDALKARAEFEKTFKKGSEEEDYPEPTLEDLKNSMKDFYTFMMYILDYYMDLPEESRNIVALWTLGSHFHNAFETYPYLFVNAMRGSGKTRLLKIIEAFADRGQMVSLITEATMFRTVGTLLLDEFEGVGRKGNESLKELLNSAYKKGTKVFRMKKKKTMEGESQVVEEFMPFRPIAMANIWGMEEVLGDRCLNLLLEKSDKRQKTLLMEDFKDFFSIHSKKTSLHAPNHLYTNFTREKGSKCRVCRVVVPRNINTKWNIYVKNQEKEQEVHNTTHTTHTHTVHKDYTNLHENELKVVEIDELLEGGDYLKIDYNSLFEKVYNVGIEGRYLELFFPLFIIAFYLGEDILDKTLKHAKKIVQDKKAEERTESRDVAVYSMVAGLEPNKFYSVVQLKNTLSLIIGEGTNDWLNSRWVGLALKRLNLVVEKRRSNSGVSVMLDIEKAKLKEKIFKPEGVID